MAYNTCKVCGANNGRAGMLIASPSRNIPDSCANCYDTATTGEIVVHSNLLRTDEELKKTFAILDDLKQPTA